MDWKELFNKVCKGCGCITIGFFLLCFIIALFDDDDDKKDDDTNATAKTEQVEKKDSVIACISTHMDPKKVHIRGN